MNTVSRELPVFGVTNRDPEVGGDNEVRVTSANDTKELGAEKTDSRKV